MCSEKDYIFNTIFSSFLPVFDFEIVFDNSINQNEIVISFDKDGIQKELILNNDFFQKANKNWLHLNSLPENNIKEMPIGRFLTEYLYQTIPVLYGKPEIIYETDNKIICNVDLFGSMFFMLTLYEELVLNVNDEHGRFNHKLSLFYKKKYYQRPLVNEYVNILKKLLLDLDFIFPNNNRIYKVVLSHDVDVPSINTYSFIGLIKNVGADIVIRKSALVAFNKIYAWVSQYIFNKSSKKDPLFNYDYIMDISDKYHIKSQFNFISINGKGGIDGNYSISETIYIELLKKIIKRGHKIGIHPGYYTIDNLNKLKYQVDIFKSILNSIEVKNYKITGRQHYLRWQNPITWRNWEYCGIAEDSSVGSEYFIGFRSGTCYEYPVYDLEIRKSLSLVEYPLVIMDVCLFKKGNIIEVDNSLNTIKSVITYFNGNVTILYHNNYITTRRQKLAYVNLLNLFCT
jgi:peptidoglycan/xylan/chitin deacetylase (PgdA/CDA1 family)